MIHALAGEQDIRNMGGLRKGLPITYWTFLIGAIAIAGVPPLAGFFSKDEILWKTFAGGHHVLWAIGMLTAFLTATYMFRLVFLTFHGERRPPTHPEMSGASTRHAAAAEHPEEEEPVAQHAGHLTHQHTGHLTHAQHPGHHPAHLHDAPAPMALALIVLAVGSVLAGFVGIPHALGGHNQIEAFLHPAFEAHAVAPIDEFQVVQPAQPAAAPGTAHAPAGAHADTATELLLMGVSVGLAAAGIGLAWFFWLRNRQAATRMARSFTPIYTLLLNKYYVDEIYNALVVQPIKQASTLVLWRGADAGLIDGAVNGVGSAVRGGSAALRRLQTGSIRAYAGSLFLGVVLILGWYLLR